jgi:hypothetical protein
VNGLRCVLLAVCIAAAICGGVRVAHRLRAAPPPASRRVTVAFTGEDEGRLEPCGCTPAMLGGLARRPARIAASREPGVRMVVVAGGSLVEGKSDYDRLRLRVVVDALRSMGCVAFSPSAVEIGDASGDRGARVTLLTAGEDLARVLVYLRATLPPGSPLVMLTDADAPAARALAAGAAGPTLVLYAGGVTDPRDDDATSGPVAVAPYPAHGKYVGFAHLSGEGADAVWTIEYRPVVPDLPEDPAIVKMKAAVLDEMRAADFVAKFAGDARFAVGGASKTIAGFAGNEACAQCHADAARAWTSSRHAQAMASLRATGDDADPGCVKCHVVGYGTGRAFVSEKKTPQFVDVGCEACHGPRATHVEARRAGKADERSAPAGERSCAACHDGEHSPDFDFAAAWPRIAHGAK